MMKFLLCLFTFCFLSCGTEVKEKKISSEEPRPWPKPKPPTAPVSFAQVKPIIDKHCALSGCHAGAGFVGSAAAFKASASLARLSNDSMPLRSSPNYDSYSSNDKNKLLGFLTD